MSGTLESLLPLFTADDVPCTGPEEIPSPRFEPFLDERALRATRPGGGLSRYPMLYIGEGCNTMFLLNQGKVIWSYSTGEGWEYDDIWMLSDGNIVFFRQSWAGMVTPTKRLIWRYEIGGPWAAIRLRNGNTLITAEAERRTVEVDRKGNIVWQCTLDEIPEPYRLADSQSCVRLRNGNTILCSRGDGGRAPQLLEITPDKEVVWSVYDWDVLGSASAVQILNDPGVPEVPGDCER